MTQPVPISTPFYELATVGTLAIATVNLTRIFPTSVLGKVPDGSFEPATSGEGVQIV